MLTALFILGIVNLLGLVLVLLTCRCLIGNFGFGFLSRYEWYRKLYAYHCYFWYLFLASVLAHTIVAFIIFGFSAF